MFIHPLSRRIFLQGAGKTMLAIPFLSSLLHRAGYAQAVTPPPRYVFMHIPYGPLYPKNFYPARTMLNKVNLFPQAKFTSWWINARPHDMALGGFPSDATNGISYYFDKKFHPFASKMTFLQGLDQVNADHYQAQLLGNMKRARANPTQTSSFYVDMPTIDHIMAYAPGFYPTLNGIVPNLVISPLYQAEFNQGFSYSFQNSVARNGAVIRGSHEYDAKKIFDRLFASIATPTTPSTSNTPLVDAIKQDYLRVRNGRAISSEDQLLLDAHIQEIADLEKIPPAIPGACTVPGSVGVAAGQGIDNGQIKSVVRDMFLAYNRLIVAAFKCQLTRVVNLDLHYNVSMILHKHDLIAGTKTPDPGYPMLPAAHKDLIDTVVFDLVNRLNTEIDPDGKTILDNSIVHLNSASSWWEHLDHDVPTVLFGSGGGKIKTGLYIDYGDQAIRNKYKTDTRISQNERAYGLLHNQLNVTVMQAMGLSPSHYNMAALGLLPSTYDPVTTTTYGETLSPDPVQNANYANSIQVAGNFLPHLKGP